MNAGTEIRNTSNVIQIADAFSNLELVQKGFVTCTVFSVSAQPYEFPYPITPPFFRRATLTVTNRRNPVLAIRSNEGLMVTSRPLTSSGSTFNFSIYVCSPTNTDRQVEYFLFDSPGGSNSTYGLQIFNNGQLTFDALKRYMRVLGRMDGRYIPGDPIYPTAYNEPVITRNFPGRQIAVCPLINAYSQHIERNELPTIRYATDGTVCRVTNGGSTVDLLYKHYLTRTDTDESSNPNRLIGGDRYHFLILDVTNY